MAPRKLGAQGRGQRDARGGARVSRRLWCRQAATSLCSIARAGHSCPARQAPPRSDARNYLMRTASPSPITCRLRCGQYEPQPLFPPRAHVLQLPYAQPRFLRAVCVSTQNVSRVSPGAPSFCARIHTGRPRHARPGLRRLLRIAARGVGDGDCVDLAPVDQSLALLPALLPTEQALLCRRDLPHPRPRRRDVPRPLLAAARLLVIDVQLV